MTDRELLQEALDALTYVGDAKDIYSDTIDALRARLAQPEPLPEKSKGALSHEEMMRRVMEALPTMPIRAVVEPTQKKPQREWVGLTEGEYEAMAEQYVTNCYFDTLKYAKAIEAKLKEKNNG